jgi:hypothetical protein
MTVIQLTKSLQAWGTQGFEGVLKKELGALGAAELPLQAGLRQGSHVSDSGFSVVLLGASESGGYLHVKTGIFYSSVIGGCSCADDPTPVSELNEYCELRLDIDAQTADATIVLLSDL